jgi:hypothetical protein
MASHPSRDELRSELRRQGLPQAYIRRLLTELDDHYEDLLEERSTSMGAARKLQVPKNGRDDLQQRLGEPAQLALFAAEQYHARSFWGRHRWLTFVIGPLPMLAVAWIVTLLGMTWMGTGIAYVCEHLFGLSDEMTRPQDHLWAQAMTMVAVSWFTIVIPPLTVAVLLCRVARRNAVNWRWPIVACTLLAIVVGFLSVGYRLALAPQEGQFMIGFTFGGSAQWILLRYLPKVAVAMGIGLLLVKRAQRQLEITA